MYSGQSVELTGVHVIISVILAGWNFVGASVRMNRSEAQTCVLIRLRTSSCICPRRSLSLWESEQRKERNVIVFPTAAGCFSAPAVQASFTALWLAFCCLSLRLLPLYIYMCVCGRGSGSFVKAFLGTNNGLSQPAKQTSAERGQLWKSTNKEQKNLSNVRLISLCYGNHFVLRLREIGLLLSTSGLIVRLTSMKMWNAAAFSCSLHSSSLSWYKKTQNILSCWSCCSPPVGSKHIKKKTHILKLQKNSVFVCIHIRTMCGSGLCFWPSYPAVIYILLLGQHPTMPCFLCIIESPSGILKRGRGLAIKGSRAAYSTRVTSKTLWKIDQVGL